MPRITVLRLTVVATAMAAAGSVQAADVRIDGRLQAAYTYFDTSAGGHGATIGDDKGQSRLGVQARQEVGETLAALGRAEVGLDPDTFGTNDDDGNPFRAREAWVGLQWGGGQLRAGRLPGAYKQAGGKHWDVMNATELQQRRAGGLAGGEYANTGFLNSLVEYRTPPMGGLELIGQYGFDERSSGSNDDAADRNGDDFLFGAIYREGPWELIGAYSRDDSGSSGENRNWKLGARFDTGEASLAYQFEKVRVRDRIDDGEVSRSDGSLDITFEALETDTRHHMVGLSQMYGAGMLWLAWGYMDADDSDFDIQNATVAWTQFFSEGFRWYTGVQYQDRGRAYQTRHMTVASTGVRFDF